MLPRLTLCIVLSLATAAVAAAPAAPEELAAMLAAADLDAATAQAGRNLLDEGIADLQARQQAEAALIEARTASANGPSRLRELERQLTVEAAAEHDAWARRLSADADVATLERVLAQERAALETRRAEEALRADELAGMLTGEAATASELARIRQQLDQLRDAGAAGAPDPGNVIDRIRLWRDAQLRLRLETELELRTLEQDTFDQRQRIAELALRRLQQQGRMLADRIADLQVRIVARAQTELALLMRTLEREVERHAAAGRSDAAAAAARESLAFGEELVVQSRLLTADRAALPAAQFGREEVEDALRATRTRIELGADSQAVGRWLWGERRRLVPPARLQQDLEATRGAIAELRLREVVLTERRRQLGEASGGVGPDGRDQVAGDATAGWNQRDGVSPRPVTREAVLDDLRAVVQRRLAVLESRDELLTGQLARTLEMRALLDRHLLWTRSHGAIDGDWLDRAGQALGDLRSTDRLGKTRALVSDNFREQPLRWIGSLLLLLVLLGLRSQAVPRIEREAAVTRHIREDSYRATARALGWTLLAAMPFPVAFALAGLLLRQVGLPGNFSDSVGVGLLSVAWPFFFTQLLRFAAIEKGLGGAHFRWRRARRASLRRWMPAFNWLVLPLWFVVAMSVARNLDLATDVTARVAVMLASLALAFGCWRILAPGQVWVVRNVEVEPSGLRKAARIACTVLVFGIMLLAVVGWVHSASLLLEAVLASVSAAVVIALVMGMLSRWMLLGERRLAFQRAQDLPPPGSAGAGDGEPEVSLQQVNEQTGRLVRALRIALIALAAIWVWADVLPAAGRLDDIPLWHVQDAGVDGANTSLPVSLMDVLTGAFILLLTWVGARNLPGLVEIGLLSRTRIDAPTRYAITSLLRYAIVIAGLLVGLAMLGMRWGQLQWMAAALTVGLGFGLQEIFANFVSGLILLFERPFRVGDIITVGEYTGTVNRIRTRATTIVDFDNREIVVPNKNFITGQLTNWTLTDSVTRLTVKVGVDYGSDPALVHRLLLQAAGEVPGVMREPEARTWFLSFGASSLDFELRVFVASVNDRLEVQDALHTRINALLLAHGVDIAYPHLNVILNPPA